MTIKMHDFKLWYSYRRRALRAKGGGGLAALNSMFKALWVTSNPIKAFFAAVTFNANQLTGSMADGCDVTGEDRLHVQCIYERMTGHSHTWADGHFGWSFKWREDWNVQKSSWFAQWTGRDAASLRDLRLRTGGQSHHLGHESRLNK